MSPNSPASYDPNPLFAWLYQRFFEHIEVDRAWVDAVREADRRGTVVYVLRNLSFVDFFALDYLTKRYELPRIRFANELGLWVLEPFGRGWLDAIRPRTLESDGEAFRRAVASGASAAVFLKRPGTLLEGKGRGKIEGDTFVRVLFDVQRTTGRPILLVPQVFIWTKKQDAAEQTLVDALFGPREWPGRLRTVAQFLGNYRSVTLRAGEPIDVRAFLESAAHDGAPANDDALVRRITYTLLRRLERERRAVLGPTRKAEDRLRDEVIRSPKLQKIIRDMAGEGETERRVLTARAFAMLRRMEATLNMNAIAALNTAFENAIRRMYSAIEIDHEGLERLREAAKEGTLLLLPSHKSHVDYMVLQHLFYRNHLQLPLIAAGENLDFFPLGPAFRRAGAFFIRRSFRGDRLYIAVVDAYIRRLMLDGWPLEFFLEGGRSRTGKLLSPKVGLLSMVVDAATGLDRKKVFMCPISIGYERLVEEQSYVHEVSGGEKKKENVTGLVSTAEVVTGRYGRLNVQFGEIIELGAFLKQFDKEPRGDDVDAAGVPARRRAAVKRLAYRVMNEINCVTAVTPGSLVATALLSHGKRGVPHDDLVSASERLARMLQCFGARFTPSLAHPTEPGKIRRAAVREACELFARAGHLDVARPDVPAEKKRKKAPVAPGEDAIYVVPDDARMSLDFSKNIVVHFFVERALVATSVLASPGPPIRRDALRARVQTLSKLFKFEFHFRADADFVRIFDEELEAMIGAGELIASGAEVTFRGDEARASLVLYARLIENFIEGYRIAARGLTHLLRGPLPMKDLVKRTMALGDRMFLAGEIERREAVSRPLIEGAFAAFLDQGYIAKTNDRVELPTSYSSQPEVATIEGKIGAFLLRRAADKT